MPTPASPPTQAVASIEQLQKRWGELARLALSQGDLELGTALAGSRVTAIDDRSVNIVCERGVSDEHMPRLRHYLAHLGIGHCSPVVTVVAPGGSEGAQRQRRLQEAKSHPLVKDALKRFEADIHLIETVSKADWLSRLEQQP